LSLQPIEAFPCGSCGGASQVVDSRPKKGYTWRRRKCLDCGRKVTTYEYIGLKPLSVQKLKKDLWDISTALEEAIVGIE